MRLTAELRAFLASIKYDSLPVEALPIMRTGFADAIGVMLAGTAEKGTGIVRRALVRPPGDVPVSPAYAADSGRSLVPTNTGSSEGGNGIPSGRGTPVSCR